MTLRAAQPSTRELFRRFLRGGVAAFALAAMPWSVFAQSDEITAEPMPDTPAMTPPVPIAPPTTMEEADAVTEAYYGEDSADAAPLPAPSMGAPARPWKLTLHGSVAGVYDDNIFISHRDRQGDFVFTLSPGARFAVGDWLEQNANFLSFDYTLSGLLFASHPSQDAIEQEALLDAQWTQARFTFRLQFHFLDLSSPDIEVGNRTRRRLYQTASLNKYELREQAFIEANLYNNVSDYETRLGSTEWIARFWLDYSSTPKLTFGPGFSVGHLEVADSPSQTYEQLLGRVTYTATDKLSLEADGGVEIRQAGTQDRVTPIINVTGTYQPFAETAIKLSAYRKVANSALLAGENYTLTGFSLEASRTVRTGCDLVLAGGYGHSRYDATRRADNVGRTDDYFFVRPAIRLAAAERLKIEIFYLYQENDSTRDRSAFRDQQVGARVRFDY